MGGPLAPHSSRAETESGSQRAMRIGEVAERIGTTARTIRYYEELGLLGAEDRRETGKHRCYTDEDVSRITEVMRLKDLLGLTLDQLKTLVEGEAMRAELRREYQETDDPRRRAELLLQLRHHAETQLGLVRHRRDALASLEADLTDRLERISQKLGELDRASGAVTARQ